jgi:[protein-PII] uridylyltransferase
MVTPLVEFDNDSSDAFTIIDITARDRVGLLFRVTRALYELNLDLASAKIVTEGVRVMDSFYVTDLLRRKVTDDVRLGRIKEELLKVLEAGGEFLSGGSSGFRCVE